MTRHRRAPRRAASALVSLAAAAAVFTACASSGNGNIGSSTLPNDYYLLVAASAEGSVVFQGNDGAGSGGLAVKLSGRDASGQLLWSVSGADADAACASPPGALVSVTSRSSTDAGQTAVDLILYSADGERLWKRTFHEAAVQPIWSGQGTVTYAVTKRTRMRLCVWRKGAVRSVSLPLSTDLASWSSSSDGCRIAALQYSDVTNAVSWLEVNSQGRPRLVASQMLGNAYITLDAEGTQAVLGGTDPLLVDWCGAHPRPLPVSYVSEAYFAGQRLCLLTSVERSGDMENRITVLDPHVKKRWSQRVTGAGVVRPDPTLRFVVYSLEPGGTAHVLRMRDGVVAPVADDVDDACLLDQRTVLIVRRDGSLASLQNPLHY